MKSAYNHTWLLNLGIVKEAKQWRNYGLISGEQHRAIGEAYPSAFFHPNLMIRILLFIATLIALGGVTGLAGLIFMEVLEDAVAGLCLVYGVASVICLESIFIRKMNHYKSGVIEALLYHAMGFLIGGIAGIADFDSITLTILACFFVFAFGSYRYLDLISTLAALCTFGSLIFYELYEMGGIGQQIIPVAFIVIFTPLCFYFRKLKHNKDAALWEDCLIVAESFSLLLVIGFKGCQH